jgi:transposase-like protein
MSEEYPRTLIELERRFVSEEACAEYLTGLRWPDGWVCPRCAGVKAWQVRRDRWRCAKCRYEMSVTAGTIFQDSHLPLTIWFRAMWQVTSQKNGISALGLQRVLGLGSYKTVWAMLHKLRRAMVRPGRERLSGSVEADETYLGGLEEGVRGRQTESKALPVRYSAQASSLTKRRSSSINVLGYSSLMTPNTTSCVRWRQVNTPFSANTDQKPAKKNAEQLANYADVGLTVPHPHRSLSTGVGLRVPEKRAAQTALRTVMSRTVFALAAE